VAEILQYGLFIKTKTLYMKTIISTFSKKISFILLLIAVTGSAYAATFTAVASGNFSSTATWTGGVVPPSTILLDQVIIPAGITVNLDNDLAINGILSQLDVQGTLTATNNSSLTVTLGNLSGAGTIVVNELDISSGPAFTFTGSLTANTINSLTSFQSSADIMVDQTINLTTGTLSLVTGGSLDVTSGGTIMVSGGLLAVGAGGSLGLTNSYNVTYTGLSSISGVELSGSGLNNVTVNVGAANSVTLSSDLTIAGTLSLTSGTLILAGNDLTINGPISASGSGGVVSTLTSNISINSAGGTTGALNFSGLTPTVNNLTVNVGASNKANISGDLTISGTLQLNSGTLSFNDADLKLSGNISGNGFLSGNAMADLTVATLTGPTLNFGPGGQIVKNLNISVGIGNSATLVSDLTVNGALSFTAGSNLNLNGNTLTLNTASSVAGSGNLLTNSTSNLVINATGGINSLSIPNAMGSLTINSGSADVKLATNTTVSGTLNLQSGKLNLNNNNLTINGDVAATGNGTISTTGGSGITIATASTTAGALRFTSNANTVDTLAINIGGNGYASIGTDLHVNNMLNFAGGKLNIGDNALMMGTTASIEGNGISSYVITSMNGYVEQHVTAGGSSSVNFPVGTMAQFAPANIHLDATSASGNVQVGVASGVMAEGTSGYLLSANQPVAAATWFVESDITSNLNLDLQVVWSSAIEVNGFNRANAYISHYTSGTWDVSTATAATAEAGGMFSLQRTGLTSLSPFTVFDNNTSTGVKDVTDNNMFSIYPNPATTNINIQSITASATPMNIDIYNTQGQIVANYKLTDGTSNISLDNLVSGSYYIKFYNGTESSTKPFIKL
jgi:hypothetical protein